MSRGKLKQGVGQDKTCHSFLSESVPCSATVPVQAERSEPQSSLDRVARCKMIKEEGMAGGILPATKGTFFT